MRKQGAKVDDSWFSAPTAEDELQKHAAMQSELKKILFPETPATKPDK